MAANLPGHLSYDSVIQLLEGRTGVYNGWHPPVMSWLLGLADGLISGTGLYVTLVSLIFFAALASLVALVRYPSWFGAIVAVACIASPQFLIYQGIVWKDVLFANAALASFATLCHIERYWTNITLRCILIALAAILLTLAALARQNGPSLLPFAALTFAFITWRHSKAGSAGWGLAVLAVLIALLAGGRAFLATKIKGESGEVRIVKLLQAYDLTAALKAQPDLSLRYLQERDPLLLQLMRTDGRRLYSPQRNDPFTRSPPLLRAIVSGPARTLRRQWLSLIAQDPGLYFHNRAEIFWWVFFTPKLALCVPVYLGIDGPPKALKRLKIEPRFDKRDEALQAYGQWFIGTPVLSHPFFLALSLGELLFLFFRRRTEDVGIALMLCAAIAFTLSFFTVSLACDYRYLYFLDLAAMTALIYIALDPHLERGLKLQRDMPQASPSRVPA